MLRGSAPSARKSLRPGGLLLLGVLLCLLLRPVGAQAPPPAPPALPSYWQHPAPGRIDAVTTLDANGDGSIEFALVAAGRTIELIQGNGEPLWTTPFEASEPIAAIAAFGNRLAVATSTTLSLLDAAQTVVWQTPLDSTATVQQLHALNNGVGNPPTLLAQFSDGALLLYDPAGALRWRYTHGEAPADQLAGVLQIADLNADGRDDILFAYATTRRLSRLDRIEADSGATVWSHAVGSVINAVGLITFDDNRPLIAVANDIGELHLLDADRQPQWQPRTLNRPITALAEIEWGSDGPLLVVGTNVGKLVAYDAQGQRVWDKAVCNSGNGWQLVDRACPNGISGQIVAAAAPHFPAQAGQPLRMVVNVVADDGTATLLLIDRNHDLLAAYQSLAIANQPYLIDSNGDLQDELLLATFGSIDLLSPGTTARSTQQVWEYRLDATPQTFLAGDFNYDGREELVIGAADGRLHQLQDNGVANWIVPAPEYSVVFLDRLVLRALGDLDDHLIIAYNATGGNGGSFVSILRADSSSAWRQLEFDESITALRVDTTNANAPLLYVALSGGQVIAYQLAYVERAIDGTNWQRAQVWSRQLSQPATAIALLQRAGESQPRPVFATDNLIQRYDLTGNQMYAVSVSLPTEFCRNPSELLFLIENGASSQHGCLLNRSVGEWLRLLGTPPRAPVWESTTFQYRPISADRWQRSNKLASIDPLLNPNAQLEPGDVLPDSQTQTYVDITSFYAGDLTGDSQIDIILGRDDGTLQLDLNASVASTLPLASPIIGISALRPEPGAAAGLVVITANSLVRQFGFQPNYPPLLTVPTVANSESQYTIEISVLDIEARNLDVFLELFDPATNRWVTQGNPQTTSGRLDRQVWILDPPDTPSRIIYRFRYSDGTDHNAAYVPPPGPPPLRPQPWSLYGALAGFGLLAALVGGLIYVRQYRQPASVARRFYLTLRRTPDMMLTQLRSRYNASGGDVELFINLANVARQQEDPFVAMLADGLFLLADRPAASLEIINAALVSAAVDGPPPLLWYDEWKTIFGRTLALMSVPSLTELSLMRPRLEAILTVNERTGGDAGPFPALLPIFDALSDSERVETVDDRLAYLGDAAILLQRLERQIRNNEQTLSSVLVRGIVEHWRGLVVATSESLRGRAEIEVQLKTQRLMPTESSTIVLELTNIGRAPAEDVIVTLQAGDARSINGTSQIVPLLAPRRPRSVSFDIALPPAERFRVAFSVQFSDRQRRDKLFEYGNIVHVLAPPRTFQPIANPYSPGTPLRRDSGLFFGRSNLFNFIASEAQRLAQQHVLILVGQRRTGKTSALLRLEQHLPADLVPIYIDCQSLGVLPGITPFFEDIAWLIADTLARRGIEVGVPDLALLDLNPGTWFQQTFVPTVQALLPPGSTLLLMFDEFEALENLVQDDILPPTLFPYLRHLMQHSSGLSFIFVGTRRLEEMTSDYWSVLFNMALYKEITFLDEAASRALITQPVAPNLLYDDLALDKIWRITAGHPYFLQLVCYSLVKRANTNQVTYVTISDVNETVDEMLGLGEVHFAYIWQRSSPAERIVLLAMAHLLDKERPFRPADLIRAIEPYQVALSPAEVLTALDVLVERRILRTVNDGANPFYELHLGLVGLWIERTKGLSKLYAGSVTTGGSPSGRFEPNP